MPRQLEKYTNEIWKNLNYFANWPLNKKIRIGDIGFLDNKQFRRQSKIDRRTIKFATRAGGAKAELTYSTRNRVCIDFKVAGRAPLSPESALSIAHAGVTITFSREGAGILHIMGYETKEIEDFESLCEPLLEFYRKKEWDESFMVVASVIEATSATIIVSDSRDGCAELVAKANIGPSQVNLANLNAGFELRRQKGLDIFVIARESVTPLFQLAQFKKRRNRMILKLYK